MKQISDAFGIDIKSALSNSDVMSLSQEELPVNNTQVVVRSEPNVKVTEQNIRKQKQEILPQIGEGGENDIEYFRKTQKVIDNVNVTSPNGRNFQVPTKIKDVSGDTTITIDTKSADNYARFNKNIEQNSYKDGYNVEFRQCKLCYDHKTKTSSGYVKGEMCPKCGGSGEIMVG